MDIHPILSIHVDLFLMKTLVRDSRFDGEREQAIRFIRRVIDHPSGYRLLIAGPEALPQNIVRVLVALSDQLDDKFRNVAGICILI